MTGHALFPVGFCCWIFSKSKWDQLLSTKSQGTVLQIAFVVHAVGFECEVVLGDFQQ